MESTRSLEGLRLLILFLPTLDQTLSFHHPTGIHLKLEAPYSRCRAHPVI